MLLVCIIFLQLAGVAWTAWNTANDRIDGVQNCVVYSIECVATCLVLASAVVADQAKKTDGEVDVEVLAQSLSLTAISGQILLVGVFFPMSVTVYNSFVVPICQLAWSGDGSRIEIACQIFMTCILLPYEIITTFFGCAGMGAAADVVAEMEGSVVELTTAASDRFAGVQQEDEDDDDAEEVESKVNGPSMPPPSLDAAGCVLPASECTQPEEEEEEEEERIKGPPSAGAKKRMKREKFLARVRMRAAASQGKSDDYSEEA